VPLARVTLFGVRELQRIEVALQNKLNQDPDAVHEGLLEAMQTKLIDYIHFVKARRSFSFFTILWEKTFCRWYLQFLDECTNQLLHCQLKMILVTEAGIFLDRILTVLSGCQVQMFYGQRLPPMKVTNLILQVFVNLNLVKDLKKNRVVEVIANGSTTTWMKNNTLGLIS
jgi:hypothetical protein